MSQSPLPPDFDPETIAEDQITEIYNSFNPFRPLEPGMVKTKNNYKIELHPFFLSVL